MERRRRFDGCEPAVEPMWSPQRVSHTHLRSKGAIGLSYHGAIERLMKMSWLRSLPQSFGDE